GGGRGARAPRRGGPDPGPGAAAAVGAALATGAGADGVVWLLPAPPSGALLPRAVELVRAIALAGGVRLLLVGAAGAPLGLAGLTRALGHELDALVRLVDLGGDDHGEPAAEPAGTMAAWLLAELADTAGPSTVRYRHGRRLTTRLVPADHAPGLADLPDGLARLGLGPESVVLLTGGARGITARVALALAEATGCAVELLGRSPEPVGRPDPLTASAPDARSLRRLLVESGLRRPSEVEGRVARVLADREIRVTLDALSRRAASVRYHQVDVRDAAAVRAVVDGVYARHGRLDGVVHGAGLVEDRLLRDKTAESFARVYETKVAGARALAAAARPGLRFLALFGSVAGVFGNRGQADYAAANDALDTLAAAWATRFPDSRVVAIDWGPWRSAPLGDIGPGGGPGGGMVSPELEREYARRGVGLIDPTAGVAACLREIAFAAPAPAAIHPPAPAAGLAAPAPGGSLTGDPAACGA
ncbi:SDR family NAD(P)-dependent oxidoreductase, partial [Frankia sp. CNm7]|uniref:SDR family NAD(P)-dependent oxidoreductase n=1 Tax=Frankia nepalensis TaxID=1836974 RepID=UPI00193157E8